MELGAIIQFSAQALCPAVLTAIISIILRIYAAKTGKLKIERPWNSNIFYTNKRRNLRYYLVQIVIGVAFGFVSMSCNIWGIKMSGVIMNVRDASPLTAGLLFGGPAGIIAGLMGGIHRIFFGDYTVIACSVSTCLAGFYAAVLRRFLFDDHKPNWSISWVTGVVMEVFHLSMVFITHTEDLVQAGHIVRACSVPLILGTSLAVYFARVLYSFLSNERLFLSSKKSHISNIFQRKLFWLVGIAFLVSTTILIFVETGITKKTAEDQLKLENAGISQTFLMLSRGNDPDMKLEQYINIADSAGMSNNGEAMIAKADGNVVSGKFVNENIYDILKVKRDEKFPDDLTKVLYKGTEYYVYAKTYDDIIVVTEYVVSDTLYASTVSIYINSFLEVFIFAALFTFVFIVIKRGVTNNISRINKSLSNISAGYLDSKVNVYDNIEFGKLSDGINQTVDSLKGYIAAESKRIEADLNMAHGIQASSLPSVFPAFPTHKEFDIYANMTPAKEVGGDFYDFYLPDRNRLAFLVADVSGKGIPAAMFMMRAKSILKSFSTQNMEIGDVFTQGNKALCEGNDNSMFVTAWQGMIDLETGDFDFANAGHNPPLIRHENGRFEYFKSRAGMVLAGMDGMPYKTQKGHLEKGDIIFVYTDGVTEATNSAGNLYGEERLLEFANSCNFTDMMDFCKKVKEDVDAFVGSAPQFDDITMLALQYKGFRSVTVRNEIAKIEDISVITEKAEAFLDEIEAPVRAKMQILVAIDELYSNIAKYSYGDVGGPADFKIEELRERTGICMTFVDGGVPYNPIMKEDPNVHLSAADRQIGGLGIFMTKKTMDDLAYEYNNGKNILKVTKYFEKG